MNRFCLTLARLCSAMWIGAAFLFVTTSIAEQVQPSFDVATKDTLALIRFPWYYGTGFVLLAVAFLATRFAGLPPRPRTAAMLLILAAILLMSADYTFIYRPIRELLSPGGIGRGPAFDRLHAWSEWLNTIGFLFSAAAAIILCAARSAEQREGEAPAEPPRSVPLSSGERGQG